MEYFEKNELLLKKTLLDFLKLSGCDCVLETQSQVAAFSKVFTPNLNIYIYFMG